jgi:hypothetical protein
MGGGRKAGLVGMKYASVFCMGNGLLFGAGAGWVMTPLRSRVTSSTSDQWQVNTTFAAAKVSRKWFPQTPW